MGSVGCLFVWVGGEGEAGKEGGGWVPSMHLVLLSNRRMLSQLEQPVHDLTKHECCNAATLCGLTDRGDALLL